MDFGLECKPCVVSLQNCTLTEYEYPLENPSKIKYKLLKLNILMFHISVFKHAESEKMMRKRHR
jgi:hypothetical protein